MAIFFITGNKNKLAEVQAMIPNVEQLELDLPELQEIDAHEIIKAKLQEALKVHDGELIVEDTSLYLDALNGLPGPLIKWFVKTIGVDGLYKIAEKFDANDLSIPQEKWFTNLSTIGNVGAGSIYIMLEELFNSGKLKKGERIFLLVPESSRFSYMYALLTVC